MADTKEKAFVEDCSKWGVQTSFGLATGFVLGFVKGFRESSHLAGKYGPNSVYRGYWASFRLSIFSWFAMCTSVDCSDD